MLLLCNWCCCCCLVIEVAWFLPPPAGVIWLSRQAISPHTQAIKSISISLSSAFNFSNLVVNTFERRRNWSPFVCDRCLFFDGLRRCLSPDHLSVTWRTHARCLYGWMAGGHRLARRYQITISVWTIYFSRSYCAFFSCDATPSYFFRSFHAIRRHLTFFRSFCAMRRHLAGRSLPSLLRFPWVCRDNMHWYHDACLASSCRWLCYETHHQQPHCLTPVRFHL